MSRRPAKKSQAEFEFGFVRWALGLALWAGFALGAHVISVIGFGFDLGPVFYPYIQAHGQIQLVGWTGLIIMGVSLHFMPRLAAVPLRKPERQLWILRLIAGGLLLRFVAQSYHAYLAPETVLFLVTNCLIAFSALLVWAGCLVYISLLVDTIRRVKNVKKRPGLKSIRGFVLVMLLGWLIYPTLTLWLLCQQTIQSTTTTDQALTELSVQCFLHFVLLPVTFAFSTRLLPLYLRLPPMDWSLSWLVLLYLAGMFMQMLATFPLSATGEAAWLPTLAAAGQALKGLTILSFILKIDVITRWRQPWTVNRIGAPGPERRQTRSGLPDYGEFGSFEKLVYAAYIWLALAATAEIALAIAALADKALPISTDVLRHCYLLGFVTNLIFGLVPRMVPGLLHKKRVASPGLVVVTFWLVNIAAVSRIVPLVLPEACVEWSPHIQSIAGIVLGLSGLWGIAAILCLAINMRNTWQS